MECYDLAKKLPSVGNHIVLKQCTNSIPTATNYPISLDLLANQPNFWDEGIVVDRNQETWYNHVEPGDRNLHGCC
ncbi:MAG: hypothetical protein ABJB76_00810 [Candidatus Nitrosocosmicus sp.]